MTNKTTIFLLLSILFFSCQEEIDDYFYEETEASVDTDILSLLKENNNYSQFVALLEKYQVDTLLDQGKIYTFFVPNNNSMENMEQGILGEEEFIQYLMTESFVNLKQIDGQSKIQTQGEKFAFIQALSNSSYTFDGVDILTGGPLTNNGRYYEIAEVVQPKPSLYQYIGATNQFYRAFLDSRDSIYLDKELSTPIGYNSDGLTIYDTVLTTVNLFEEEFFPVSIEFRDYKATMLLFTQEQYDAAIEIVSEELGVETEDIPEIWQNEVLMPYLLEQSVFRNSLPYSAFSIGRAKNILGDSVDVYPNNISPEFFDCSNGRAYNYVNFQVPDHLYKVMDTIPMSTLLFDKGSGLWGWYEDATVTGQAFNPVRIGNAGSTFGNTLLIDMGAKFEGDFSLAYTHKNIFPGTYKLTVRANTSKTGYYNVYVNGKQYPVDIGDGNGPQFDFDFFDLREGVISSVTNEFYPFINSFCSFDILIDNISEFGDVEVKLVYAGPSRRNNKNCGLNIDFISLEYFNDKN